MQQKSMPYLTILKSVVYYALKYLKYNPDKKELIGIKPKVIKEEDPQKQTLFAKLPLTQISDVLRIKKGPAGQRYGLLGQLFNFESLDRSWNLCQYF